MTGVTRTQSKRWNLPANVCISFSETPGPHLLVWSRPQRVVASERETFREIGMHSQCDKVLSNMRGCIPSLRLSHDTHGLHRVYIRLGHHGKEDRDITYCCHNCVVQLKFRARFWIPRIRAHHRG